MLPVQNVPIDSMPGVYRLGWRHGLLDEVAEARSYGVNQVGGQQGGKLLEAQLGCAAGLASVCCFLLRTATEKAWQRCQWHRSVNCPLPAVTQR